jgi:hypothetical protein
MNEVIKPGVKTKILLLSATPVNNDLKDLRNQLYFITEDNDHAFADLIAIPSLKEMLAAAQKVFTAWTERQLERRTSDLFWKGSTAFFKLLDELTIARPRNHINHSYKDTIKELGRFPRTEYAAAFYYVIC